MKNYFCLTLVTLFTFSLFAQSSDLDRFIYNSKTIQLPKNYTEPDLRNYSISHDNTIPFRFDPYRITINGFAQVESKGIYYLHISKISKVNFAPPELIERKEENKDKDGKVLDIKYYYKVSTKLSISGTASWEGNDENLLISLNHTEDFSTIEYAKSKMAIDNYNIQNSAWLDIFKINYEKKLYDQLNRQINAQFGYVFDKKSELVWLIGSKKHPEYENQQNVFQIMKDQFNYVEYERLPENILEGLQPAIDIFLKQINTYKEDKKKDKKIRYSAYYNLMNLYYNIDDFANAEKYANMLIANEYDENDGKRMVDNVKKIKEKMQTNKVNSLHFEIQNEKNYIQSY